MSTISVSTQDPAWHQPLLAYLPFIRAIAFKAYQGLGAAAREEAIQEVIADTTVGLAGLAAQGRSHFWLIPALARYAVRRQNAGRRVGTAMNKHDVLSAVPREAAKVVSLDALAGADRAGWRLAVADSHLTNPADAACFRVDFEQWLSELPDRLQQLALALAEGERPGDLARRLKLSPGRISQLRDELRDAWDAFHGEEAAAMRSTAAA